MPDGQATLPFAVSPLPGPFGAEIAGFDVRELNSPQPVLDVLHESQVVVFRDQRLSPAEYVTFSRLFGDLQLQVLDRFIHPAQREIYVLSNVVEDGKPIGNSNDGFTWHTDQSARPQPTAYTMLYGVETPPEGADTLYASTYLSFEALPAAEQHKYTAMRALFSHARLHAQQRTILADRSARDDHAPLSAEDQQKLDANTAVHPLVRTHPFTGRKGLYLGTLSCAGIDGMTENDGLGLMARLVDHSIQEPYAYRHRWQPRDLVMWDNRGLLHTATDYDKQKYRRVMWRTSVMGEAPF
jgi:taurine dioxygenase